MTLKHAEAIARLEYATRVCKDDDYADPATLRELADAMRSLAAFECEPDRQIELRTGASYLERKRMLIMSTDFR